MGKRKIQIVKEFEKLTFRPMKNWINRPKRELEKVLKYEKNLIKDIMR